MMITQVLIIKPLNHPPEEEKLARLYFLSLGYLGSPSFGMVVKIGTEFLNIS